jgi:uncharacterized membrane protein
MLTTENVSDTVATIPTNLNQNERWGSAIAGGALLLFGLNRLSVPAVVLTVVGGALLSRGMTGYCPFKATDSRGRRRDENLHLSHSDETEAARSASERSAARPKAGARRGR